MLNRPKTGVFLSLAIFAITICASTAHAFQNWVFDSNHPGSVTKNANQITVELPIAIAVGLSPIRLRPNGSGEYITVYLDTRNEPGDTLQGADYAIYVHSDKWTLRKSHQPGDYSVEVATGNIEQMKARSKVSPGEGIIFRFADSLIQGEIIRCWNVTSILTPSTGSNTTTDHTELVLQEMSVIQGLRQLKEAKNDKIKMWLHISQPAETIIRNREFDLPDDNFDLTKFADAVEEIFLDSVDYFFKVMPNTPVQEFHVVIDDFGTRRRSTTASAVGKTRVIRIDLRRWHKMYLGEKAAHAWANSIHEFTHIVNYSVDGAENKYHLEMTAVLFEAMNFIRKKGTQEFEQTYLESAPLYSAAHVQSAQFLDNAPLRHLMHAFVCKVLNGSYSTDPPLETIREKGQAIEKFATHYLSNPKTGDAGFDDSLQQMGFKDESGEALTLMKIQQDVYDTLIR